MAKFAGFTCDGCLEVWTKDKMTVESYRYSGAIKKSIKRRELCPPCVEKAIGTTTVTPQEREAVLDHVV